MFWISFWKRLVLRRKKHKPPTNSKFVHQRKLFKSIKNNVKIGEINSKAGSAGFIARQFGSLVHIFHSSGHYFLLPCEYFDRGLDRNQRQVVVFHEPLEMLAQIVVHAKTQHKILQLFHQPSKKCFLYSSFQALKVGLSKTSTRDG